MGGEGKEVGKWYGVLMGAGRKSAFNYQLRHSSMNECS